LCHAWRRLTAVSVSPRMMGSGGELAPRRSSHAGLSPALRRAAFNH
jgi:hypothetical protein